MATKKYLTGPDPEMDELLGIKRDKEDPSARGNLTGPDPEMDELLGIKRSAPEAEPVQNEPEVPNAAIEKAKGYLKSIGEGVSDAAKRAAMNVSRTTLDASASAGDLFSGASKLAEAGEKYLPESMRGVTRSGAKDYWQKQSQGARTKAQEISKRLQPNIVEDIVSSALGMMMRPQVMAVPAAVATLPAVGAVESYGRDEGGKQIAQAALSNLAMAGGAKAAHGLSRPLRMATGGATMGGVTAAQGGTPEDILKSVVEGAVFNVPGGKGYRDLKSELVDSYDPRNRMRAKVAEDIAKQKSAEEAQVAALIEEALARRANIKARDESVEGSQLPSQLEVANRRLKEQGLEEIVPKRRILMAGEGAEPQKLVSPDIVVPERIEKVKPSAKPSSKDIVIPQGDTVISAKEYLKQKSAEATAEAQRKQNALDQAQFARKELPEQKPDMALEEEGSNLFAKQKSLKLYSGIPVDEIGNVLKMKVNPKGWGENLAAEDGAPYVMKDGRLIPVTAGNVKTPESVVANIGDWKDIRRSSILFKDLDRQMEVVTGKDYPTVRRYIIENRERATNGYVNEVASYKKQLKEYIGDKLGIKARSKESAAVQRYGEKRMTLEQLKQEQPKKWEKIVEAEKWFRENYDRILDATNNVLVKHNREPIKRRQDYFTHFNDIWNIYQQIMGPKDVVDANLVGISEFTKPNAPFNPFAKKRLGGKFTDDAVSGFERYIVPTLKQKWLTPEIARLRSFAKAIEQKTLNNSGQLGKFILSLNQHANALAGKTNPFDRFIQDYAVGRKAIRLINWTSQRLGRNVIIGKVSSALMQTASAPATLARTGPYNMLKGMYATLSSAMKGKSLQKISPFLERRYADLGPVNPRILEKAQNVAAVPFRVVEQFATTSSWYANYFHARSEGLEHPEAVKYSDHWTRRQVGGRAAGEKPLAFESNLGNLAMQFQYEVNNLTQQYLQDFKPTSFENIKGLGLLIVWSYLFNNFYDKVMGRRPLPDVIDMTKDVIETRGVGKKIGRVAGEVLSNVAGGQTVAAALPEKTRKSYMGRTEVGWYGGGAPIVSATQRAIENPASMVTSFALPFGGGQIASTRAGIEAVEQSPKKLTKLQKAKAYTFGPMSLSASDTEAEKTAKAIWRSKSFDVDDEAREKAKLKRKAWSAKKRGEPIPQEVIEARKRGELSDKDVKSIKELAKMPEIERLIKSLPLDEALDVYEQATPQERAQIKDRINAKWRNFKKMKSESAVKKMRQRIKEIKEASKD